jgi:HK97 family phage major capsid protein
MNLKEILKLIATMKAKGTRTATELKKLKEAVSTLSEDSREAVNEQVAEVEALTEVDETKEAEQAVKSLLDSAVKGIKESFADEVKGIKDEVKEFVKQTDEARAKKVGVYAPEVQEQRKGLNDRLRALIKSLVNKGDDYAQYVKEMTTDGANTPYAGYTVDSELSAEIRHLTTQHGVARREMTTLPLVKHSYKSNTLTTDVVVAWVDEVGAIASTQVVLGQGELELKKLAAIVCFTNELLEDTEIDFVNFIGSRVAEAIAKAEDDAFFKGDGTSTYGSFTGLLANASVNEVVMAATTFASIDYDDLVDLQDATPAGALPNAKYYMNRTIRSFIRKLKDNNGQYIYSPANSSGPSTLDGYPLVLVESMPAKTATAADTSFVLFGDLRKACIMGYKSSGLRAEMFDAGIIRNAAADADINLITSDRKAIRFVERTGYVCILPTAVTKLTTAAASA